MISYSLVAELDFYNTRCSYPTRPRTTRAVKIISLRIKFILIYSIFDLFYKLKANTHYVFLRDDNLHKSSDNHADHQCLVHTDEKYISKNVNNIVLLVCNTNHVKKMINFK